MLQPEQTAYMPLAEAATRLKLTGGFLRRRPSQATSTIRMNGDSTPSSTISFPFPVLSTQVRSQAFGPGADGIPIPVVAFLPNPE